MLDETITDEALALKDALKAKRDTNNISNQEIADRSGLSIHTVTNYFSSRSKASSAFTVGKICMALHISFDRAFGIVPDDTPQELNENLSRISDLEQKNRELQKELDHKSEITSMQKSAIKKLQWVIIVLAAVALIYFIRFDVLNPNYGIIQW